MSSISPVPIFPQRNAVRKTFSPSDHYSGQKHHFFRDTHRVHCCRDRRRAWSALKIRPKPEYSNERRYCRKCQASIRRSLLHSIIRISFLHRQQKRGAAVFLLRRPSFKCRKAALEPTSSDPLPLCEAKGLYETF